MKLLNRVAKVTLIAQPTGFIASNPQFFEKVGNALEITDHRIQADIQKGSGKEPNSCTLTITNLSESTRASLETGQMSVIVQAGHNGVYRHIFSGDRRFAFSTLKKTDWETKIQVGDGARAYAHARMNRSYKPPIQVRKVLQDAARSMNLELPPEVEQSLELRQALVSGISTLGPTRDILTRLLAPYGYNWSVQNGQLQILRDEQFSADEALVVSPDTGLIGSPAREPPDKDGKKKDVTFEHILYPEIMPGIRIRLDSLAIKGLFKVRELTHTFDTKGEAWKSAVKVIPLQPSDK